MTQQNLALVTGANGHLVNNLVSYQNKKNVDKKQFNNKLATLIVFFLISSISVFGQNLKTKSDSTKVFVSIETDPAFWAGTLPNGLGFDANIDFRLAKYPRLRLGTLVYSGKWSGELGKTVLLTDDFSEDNWETQWNGLGIEAQYQFRFGLKRGGFQPGLRLQWNQFLYNQNNLEKGEANHLVLTPQLGFQWFPFKKIGFYVLPWAGVQIPTIGTKKIITDAVERETRKIMPVVTVHIGWELKF